MHKNCSIVPYLFGKFFPGNTPQICRGGVKRLQCPEVLLRRRGLALSGAGRIRIIGLEQYPLERNFHKRSPVFFGAFIQKSGRERYIGAQARKLRGDLRRPGEPVDDERRAAPVIARAELSEQGLPCLHAMHGKRFCRFERYVELAAEYPELFAEIDRFSGPVQPYLAYAGVAGSQAGPQVLLPPAAGLVCVPGMHAVERHYAPVRSSERLHAVPVGRRRSVAEEPAHSARGGIAQYTRGLRPGVLQMYVSVLQHRLYLFLF